MQHVVIRPIFTEKSMEDAKNGKFTFAVFRSANKDVIKKEIEATYSVQVIDIATVTVKGKTKRVGKKRTEKAIGVTKKALVALKKGQKIDAFDLGEKKK